MGPERQHCLDASLAVEQALRQQLRPAKIKLAALGNMVSHLHWRGIAGFAWDSHFPAPVWAAAQRGTVEAALSAQLPAAQQQSSRAANGYSPLRLGLTCWRVTKIGSDDLAMQFVLL